MRLEHRGRIPADRATVWALMTDSPRVATCIPNVRIEGEPVDGTYRGVLSTRIGIIQVTFEGTVRLESEEPERWTACLRAEGRALQSMGDLRALTTMTLAQISDTETELQVATDAQLFGRLGEMGAPLIRRTADAMMNQFTRNVRQQLSLVA